jgi:hypothetical protein
VIYPLSLWSKIRPATAGKLWRREGQGEGALLRPEVSRRDAEAQSVCHCAVFSASPRLCVNHSAVMVGLAQLDPPYAYAWINWQKRHQSASSPQGKCRQTHCWASSPRANPLWRTSSGTRRFGQERWIHCVAKCLSLESSLRPRSQPEKRKKWVSPVQCPLFNAQYQSVRSE